MLPHNLGDHLEGARTCSLIQIGYGTRNGSPSLVRALAQPDKEMAAQLVLDQMIHVKSSYIHQLLGQTCF